MHFSRIYVGTLILNMLVSGGYTHHFVYYANVLPKLFIGLFHFSFFSILSQYIFTITYLEIQGIDQYYPSIRVDAV